MSLAGYDSADMDDLNFVVISTGFDSVYITRQIDPFKPRSLSNRANFLHVV